MRMKLTALAGAALLFAVTAAYAAGLWPTYPIVGSASFCAGTSTGVSSQVCTTTVPAGPSIVTGNELIPADTALAGGSAPQTVRLTLGSLNALPIQVVTVPPFTASLISAANNSGGVLYHSAAAITQAVNITLPQSPIDGQQFAIASDRGLEAMTVSAGALTLGNTGAVTVLTPSTTVPGSAGYRYLYNAALLTWFRLQ